MKNVVIIGNSIAGFTVASGLRQKGVPCAVTAISDEAFPFYDKKRLPDFLAGTVKEKDLYLAREEYYQNNAVTFLKEASVVSVNASRKTVSFKERQPLSYDYLVVCSGCRYEAADIPGGRKTNVFTLGNLTDFKEFASFLNRCLVESVCLCGHDDFALATARALAARGKEVRVVGSACACPCPSAVPVAGSGSQPPDQAPEGSGQLEWSEEPVSEIIGESEVQAVRFSTGKIVGVQTVVFMEGAKANREFLKNTAVGIENDRIIVDGQFRTAVADIFACGSVATGPGGAAASWEEAKAQGMALVETLAPLVGS